MSGDDLEQFERVDEIHDTQVLSVPASAVGGQTDQEFGQSGQFEALEMYELDDVALDRDEIAVLLWAEHDLIAGILSTATADGTLHVGLEVSASPALSAITRPLGGASLTPGVGSHETSGDFDVEIANNAAENNADIVGRTLHALAYGPITDGATGVGGAGTAGTDEWVGSPAAEPVWDVRDSMFLNGFVEHSNDDDAALFAELRYRHVYGVMEL